ncbi:hypothetical protein ABBQ38_001798 [Trebouxia sp. C0009 RCD-2024]
MSGASNNPSGRPKGRGGQATKRGPASAPSAQQKLATANTEAASGTPPQGQMHHNTWVPKPTVQLKQQEQSSAEGGGWELDKVSYRVALTQEDIDTVVFLTQEASAAQDPDMQEQLWAAAKSYAQGLSTGPLPPSINKWLLPRSLMESYRRRPTSNVPQPAGDGGAAVGHQQQPPKPEGPLQAPKQEGPPQANKPELFLPDPKPEAPPQVTLQGVKALADELSKKLAQSAQETKAAVQAFHNALGIAEKDAQKAAKTLKDVKQAVQTLEGANALFAGVHTSVTALLESIQQLEGAGSGNT